MFFETWLAFAATSAVIVLIPGPTVMLVVSYALGQGWRVALPIAIGVALGDLVAMTLSLIGLGALLATSGELFLALRWAGAAYLVYLGYKLWRSEGSLTASPLSDRTAPLKMLGHAFIVTALNPKSLTFFIAFVPQFLDSTRPMLPQMVAAEVTFVALAFANVLFYALAASRARILVKSPGALRLFNRVGGGLLMGAGVYTVSTAARG